MGTANVPDAGCDHCQGPAIVWQRYSGAHLCARHFRDSVESRARKETNRQVPLRRGAKVAIAYSGGKDSTVALALMTDLRQVRPDLELVALTVDEGIEGYRPKALEIAAKEAGRLGVPHQVRRMKEFSGATMDEAHAQESDMGACSLCGVFRRRLMNDFAKSIGADALVTGHNLDDAAQSILMNLTSANLDQLSRLAPHVERKPGFVPRLMPLRTIPETEVYLYALTRGLQWHDEECPYSRTAQRQVFRDVLYRLEDARPGTRHALLRAQDELQPLLRSARPPGEVHACLECGEPTTGQTCKACQFRRRVAQPA